MLVLILAVIALLVALYALEVTNREPDKFSWADEETIKRMKRHQEITKAHDDFVVAYGFEPTARQLWGFMGLEE